MKIFAVLFVILSAHLSSQEIKERRIKNISILIQKEFNNGEKEIKYEQFQFDTNFRLTVHIDDSMIHLYSPSKSFKEDSIQEYDLLNNKLYYSPCFIINGHRLILVKEYFYCDDASPFEQTFNKYNYVSSCKRKLSDYTETIFYYYTWYD